MVSIITDTDTPRLHYVLDFLSGFFGRPFVRNGAEGVRVYYGAESSDALVTIRPSGLLNETGIRFHDLEVMRHREGFPIFFTDETDFGFDIFSAIFYLITRYEEYVKKERDSHGRFDHRASVAFEYGFLDRPLVHEWLAFFSEAVFGERILPPFSLQLTYDVDMAWSYRHKGFARNAGGLLRSLLRRDGTVAERIAVLSGHRPDPFDNFGLMDALHRQYGLRPTYFIHAGTARGPYDKNIPLAHPAMQRLVRKLAASCPVALHPSWQSGDAAGLLEKEKAALEAAVGRKVTASRQHYIRMTLPDTYRALIAAGITDDYSMGYGSINGFRASVAVPFYWYDLQAGQATNLLLHPFCFMDANAFYEQGQDAAQTELELDRYLQTFKAWGGTFSSVWHNSFLGEGVGFGGWSVLWRSFLHEATASLPRSD
ncbi:hypothetical protein EPD60_08535 [Flaviaesturariibacter flavus]|uniref:DUF7033 domain-containing protein n=1 Tax=Flaviaesturariibacter flavus TaxID=2502780 RepID=A0A4R1BAR8_9BACT|nr:polysaccharide deacetylase family protein [Flaviaesturariibacter flavus]TCJ14050.1 hypothetical protein EPD60_08535 [Flaviaesturariibacter flavus]